MSSTAIVISHLPRSTVRKIACIHALWNTGVIMDEESVKTDCVLHGLGLVHRWISELEGSHRIYAFELMSLVMAGELTNDEAFLLLDNTHTNVPRSLCPNAITP